MTRRTNVRRYALACVVVNALACSGAPAPHTATQGPPAVILERFTLATEGGQFVLLDGDARVSIPRAWLVPDTRDPLDIYVSSVEYDRTVHGFVVSEDTIGLHVSSYAIQPSGSAQAAAGRDVFLIYKPASASLYLGLGSLGVTKWRLREDNCFAAGYTRFVVADIDGDARIDIGVQRDEVKCPREIVEDMEVTGEPVEIHHRVQWHVFEGQGWRHDPAHDGVLASKGYRELPAIHLVESPLTFVKRHID